MSHLTETITQLNPFLTTKLYIPRTPPSLVPRPRLLARLDEGLERAVTVVLAPAGFGKTTLLGEWLSQTEAQKHKETGKRQMQAAWLSLDEADNDPVRFVGYLTAALQTIDPHIGQSLSAHLGSSPTAVNIDDPTQLTAALAAVINDLTAVEGEMTLVLDDYHLITAAVVHQALAFLLEHLPPSVHFIVASRRQPSLPLAKLRARGQLLELTAADLRFSPDEAAAFLNQVMDLDLSAEEIATLEGKTEGWITGLQLAALSMREREDVAHFIAAFSGSHRYILDYLAEEVLARQPEPVQTFLLQTSVLSRLTAPLCDELLHKNEKSEGTRDQESQSDEKPPLPPHSSAPVPSQDSQTTLDYLEKSNLFLLPLDDERRWYRYHHLFADFLRDRLRHHWGPGKVAELHQRAAAWYERQGWTAEATGHALAAADVERAARLIEQSGRTLLRRSELSTLLHWVAALPGESIRVRPQLSLYHAWALVLTGQFDALEARLTADEAAAADRTDSQSGPDVAGEIITIRATVAYFQRDLSQAAMLYRQALTQLPPGNLFLREAVAMSLATVYHLDGKLREAQAAFADAEKISETNQNLYTALVAALNLAHVQIEQANLHQAAETYRRAWAQTAAQQAKEATAIAGRAKIGLGQLFYQWNDLAETTAQVEQGLAWGEEREDSVTLVSGYLILARIELAQGHSAAAAQVLEKAEALSRQHHLSGWQVRLAAQRIRLALHQADLETASRWLQRVETHLHSDSPDDSAGFFDDLQRVERLARVRWLLAQEKAAEALELLAALQQAAEIEQRIGLLIEVLLLRAISYQAQNDFFQATTLLDQALTLAETAGYVRLFLDEGEPVATLLRYALSRRLTSQRVYTDKLLEAFKKESIPDRSPTQPALVEPLSERELEILHLIADGLSNRQIANQLALTEGTVKWHINNIYGKLGVRRRTQALARARALNVL